MLTPRKAAEFAEYAATSADPKVALEAAKVLEIYEKKKIDPVDPVATTTSKPLTEVAREKVANLIKSVTNVEMKNEDIIWLVVFMALCLITTYTNYLRLKDTLVN